MEQKQIEEVLNAIKEASKNRKFKQSVDLVITLKKTSPKENIQIDTLISPPNPVKTSKVCALVDKDMYMRAKAVFDNTINREDFDKYDKKKIKKLSREYDFFVGEAGIMPQIAAKFGKQLTGIGKMPNPKTNTVINPETKIEELNENLRRSFRISNKKNLAVSVKIGDADWDNSKLIENLKYVQNTLIKLLPSGESNIRKIYLKTTMGKPVSI